jgi:hypothetical protein
VASSAGQDRGSQLREIPIQVIPLSVFKELTQQLLGVVLRKTIWLKVEGLK